MTANDIQKLREETGAGVMDCKKALDEAKGDYAKAIEVIKKQGAAKALKKGSRVAGAGHLESYIHSGRVGVLLEVRAETDFVTRSEPFREFTKNLAMHIAAANPENIEALLAQPYVRDESMTIKDLLTALISKLGEKIEVVRFTRYEL